MADLEKILREVSYPGRGITIGRSADGKKAVIAYFIMGRSSNSRNRVFVTEGDGIRTEAFDPSKMEDPSLIIYAPVRVLGNKTIVTNVNYSFGELMQQAGLNTLLGMGTTFFILILLSLIIAGFGKLFVSLDKRKAEKDAAERKAAAASQSAPAAAPAPVAAQSDDGALIAVIAAAVSAYREQAEPTVAPDGFVVRKIRRIGRK